MKLTFTVDTEDLYGEDGIGLESLIADALKREIIRNAKDQLKTEQFAEFSRLASDTIIADVKLRMMNFLSEEIVLTEGWGKKTFVGSVEDLIKLRFDEVLLRPVDNSGKTLQGCTTASKTWIEFAIEDKLKGTLELIVKRAAESIVANVNNEVKQKLIEFKDQAIKDQVDKTWVQLFKKE